MDYITYRDIVTRACNNMIKDNNKLFVLDVSKDLLWSTYLNSFPEEDVRQQHNCINCKHFITRFSKVVYIDDNYQIHSFWEDVKVDDSIYGDIASNMLQAIKGAKICDVFYSIEDTIGRMNNIQTLPDGYFVTWNHFYVQLPRIFTLDKDTISSIKARKYSDYQVWKNTLNRISLDSVESVIELIEDNNLYRGDQYSGIVHQLYEYLSKAYTVENLNNFIWKTSVSLPESVTHIINTSIGTLIEDINNGIGIEKAVKSYEGKVASTNYHRPKGIITKAQIEKAYKTVQELGYEESLERCHAKVEDISVEDVLFVNRETRKHMIGGFDKLMKEIPSNQSHVKPIPINIEDFITKVIPESTKLELYMDNSLITNLVTLTAPVNKDAPSIFKWNNGFAWVYNGNTSDSIKQRVKEVGGKVNGYMRISLHWFNYDDLDLHMKLPNGAEVYYGNKLGLLDVDMNPNGGNTNNERLQPKKYSRNSVENIIFNTIPDKGFYEVWVNQFCKMESIDYGFEVEVEINGNITTYTYNDIVSTGSNVQVFSFTSDGKSVTINKEFLPKENSSKEVWNIVTKSWVEVSAMCLSPNYWGENKVGSKHYLFLLKDCKNPDPVRGYFNEYLKDELIRNHKRVFEVLASKCLTPYSDSQMSGLGFISSSHKEISIKVDSHKIYKVTI